MTNTEGSPAEEREHPHCNGICTTVHGDCDTTRYIWAQTGADDEEGTVDHRRSGHVRNDARLGWHTAVDVGTAFVKHCCRHTQADSSKAHGLAHSS